MSNLIKTYEDILRSSRIVSDEEGYLSVELNSETTPFVVEGKRVVLPLKEQLRNPEDKLIFHPLRENPLESRISLSVEVYRKAFNVVANVSLSYLATSLLRIACSVSDHRKLNPEQGEFLVHVKDADEKTFENWLKVLGKIPVDRNKDSIVSLFIKRGGVVDGEKFKRATIVDFPLYREILEAEQNDDRVAGIKLRKKDIRTLQSLFEFMIPGIEEKNSYSQGSNSNIAPTMESLLKVVEKIALIIHNHVERFGDLIDDPESMLIYCDWLDAIEDIDSLYPQIKLILPQNGNEPYQGDDEVEVDSKASLKSNRKSNLKSRDLNEAFSTPSKDPSRSAPINEPSRRVSAPKPSGKKVIGLNEAFQGARFGMSAQYGFSNQGLGMRSTGFGHYGSLSFRTGSDI